MSAQIPCRVAQDLARYQDQQSDRDELSNSEVATKFRDILTADLGEFSDLVFTERVRDSVDETLQAIACSGSDAELLKFARMIRTTLKDSAWDAAYAYCASPEAGRKQLARQIFGEAA